MIKIASQHANTKKQEEITSLLIPLQGRVLLVPTVTVAEMAAYNRPEPIANAPAWLLGFYHWREQKVPLLSFEVLNGEPCPAPAAKSRVAVFNNTGISDELPFIAIPTQGIPRLARVTDNEITERDDAANKAFDFMQVNVSGEDAVIPDISALENAYLNWKGTIF